MAAQQIPLGLPDHYPNEMVASSQASPILPSVCVHNNTRERTTGEKRGRPGSIHHMSGREVDVGGEGPIFEYIRTKLESKFLTGQDE